MELFFDNEESSGIIHGLCIRLYGYCEDDAPVDCSCHCRLWLVVRGAPKMRVFVVLVISLIVTLAPTTISIFDRKVVRKWRAK